MQQRRKASFITLVVSAAVLVSLLTTGTVFVWAHGTSASHTASTGASLSSILSKATAFKPLHPAAYAQAKALANARAGQNQAAPAAPASHAPAAFASFQGQDMLNPLVKITPSDSTGAIGTTRYVELVNQKFGIYNRSGNLLSGDTLNTLANRPSTDFLFDVQVQWDPVTNRFYYVMDDIVNGNDFEITFGFSKTDSPNSAADWCSGYIKSFGYGTTGGFPDYPKLGVDKNFLLIGVNHFDQTITNYLGSDVLWISKPAAGAITTCPLGSTFLSGKQKALTNADSSLMSTPVPATETDPAPGLVVGAQDISTTPTGTYITLYQVSKNKANGTALFSGPKTVTLPGYYNYTMPPSAPQAGSSFKIDTLDGRLTQAISDRDPRTQRYGIWTQHTVAGPHGGKSQVNWMDIDTGITTPSVYEGGIVKDPSLYVFNGAVTTDRLYSVNPTTGAITKAFGKSLALGLTTSSATTDPAIQMVSKIGNSPTSPFTLIKQSPGPDVDFSCSVTTPCRWGDYSAATPDPAASTTSFSGQIWFTNMWNQAGTDSTSIDWSTWNWGASL